MALARCLMDGGYYPESRAVYEEILKWDGHDHLGVRYEIIQLYHEAGDRKALWDLVDRFAEDDLAVLSYERLWLALVEEKETATIEKLARKAKEANPHVPAYLAGRAAPPYAGGDGYIHVGKEDEAADYAAMARYWWVGEPKTRAWVEAEAEGE